MKTKKLYHGTKCIDIESVINHPSMKPSANGYGLYLTNSEMVAANYGYVIVFVVPFDFEVDVIRPMPGCEDTSWEGKMEYVINTQKTWVEFMKVIEDAYYEPLAIPF